MVLAFAMMGLLKNPQIGNVIIEDDVDRFVPLSIELQWGQQL
jgi:hypothetical protein